VDAVDECDEGITTLLSGFSIISHRRDSPITKIMPSYRPSETINRQTQQKEHFKCASIAIQAMIFSLLSDPG
jgi:hypothetical protein